MARLARFVLPHHPQHITLKSINKMTLFQKDEDFQCYLTLLKEGAEKHSVAVHAYALMPSEIHLLLTPSTEQGVSKLMQMLGRYYVQHFNKSYDRSGTLWEGRYRGNLVDPEHYLLKVCRFMELLPVEAGLVKSPADYPWTSYAENAGDTWFDIVTPHQEYKNLSDRPEQQGQIYQLLHQSGLNEEEIQRIRNSSLKGWVLGDADYLAEIEKLTQRQVSPKPKGGDRRSDKYRERERLKALGLSEAEIAEKLVAMEAEKSAQKQAEAEQQVKVEPEVVIEIDEASATALSKQFNGEDAPATVTIEEEVEQEASGSLSALTKTEPVEEAPDLEQTVSLEAKPEPEDKTEPEFKPDPQPEPEPEPQKAPKKTKAQQRKEDIDEVQGSLF